MLNSGRFFLFFFLFSSFSSTTSTVALTAKRLRFTATTSLVLVPR